MAKKKEDKRVIVTTMGAITHPKGMGGQSIAEKKGPFKPSKLGEKVYCETGFVNPTKRRY